MLSFRTAFTCITCFFSFAGAGLATTTVTSTSCTVNISAAPPYANNPEAVPVNLSSTDPSSCDLSGTSGGNPHFIYSVGALALPGSASSGVIGSVSTGQLQASNSYEETFSPNAVGPAGFKFDASAQSWIESQFTTAGATRMGMLSFTPSYGVDNFNGHSQGSGDVTFTQGAFTVSLNGTCSWGGEQLHEYICNTQSFAIQLGSPFRIIASAMVSEPSTISASNSDSTAFGEAGSFTITDEDGMPVSSIFVMVPEPGTIATITLPLLFLLVEGISRRQRCQLLRQA